MPLPRYRENEFCSRRWSQLTFTSLSKRSTTSLAFTNRMAVIYWVTLRRPI